MIRAFSIVLVLGSLGVSFDSADAQSRGRIQFSEELIQAEVQKPEVPIIITRQSRYTAYTLELRESFLEKVIESVKEPPF